MSDDTLIIKTDHIEVEVVDSETARVAFDIVEPILADHLGETVTGPYQFQKKVEYVATCPECNHSWERKAVDDTRATCPQCTHGWVHDVRGRDREDAAIVSEVMG